MALLGFGVQTPGAIAKLRKAAEALAVMTATAYARSLSVDAVLMVASGVCRRHWRDAPAGTDGVAVNVKAWLGKSG